MRLNPDCIRAILFAIEDTCDMSSIFYSGDQEDIEKIKGYTLDEIRYHARQCDFAGLLYGYKADLSGNFQVQDLSAKGHEFLANIREDTVWNKVKGTAKKAGSESMSALLQIASGVVAQMINSQLGLL